MLLQSLLRTLYSLKRKSQNSSFPKHSPLCAFILTYNLVSSFTSFASYLYTAHSAILLIISVKERDRTYRSNRLFVSEETWNWRSDISQEEFNSVRHKITLELKAQAAFSSRRGWTRNICYSAHLKNNLKDTLPHPKGTNNTDLLIKACKNFFIFKASNHDPFNSKSSRSCN